MKQQRGQGNTDVCVMVGIGMTGLLWHFQQLSEQLITPTSTRALPEVSGHILTNENYHRKSICESAKPLFAADSHQEILDIQQQAELFHNQGGNLKTLQEFLDVHIDSTFQAAGVSYIPKGQSEPVDATKESIKDSIYNDFKHWDETKNGEKRRGGYDQRKVEGAFTKTVPGLMNGNRGMVDVMEPTAGFEKWKTAMGPQGPTCLDMHTIHQRGTKSYQDKYMCNYKDYLRETTGTTEAGESDIATSSTKEKKGNCNIISIGSNDQWGFETVVTSETTCVTHTFDCTIVDPKHKPASETVHFYSSCIAAENKVMNHRTYETYSSLLQKIGLTEAPTFLKMDVEGFEFDVLTSMLREAQQDSSNQSAGGGDVLLLPQQIGIELHYYTRMYDLPWNMRSRQTGELSMLFGMMYRLGGYLPVSYDFDKGCASCLEVLFVRIFC